jgi:hypothetical protein
VQLLLAAFAPLQPLDPELAEMPAVHRIGADTSSLLRSQIAVYSGFGNALRHQPRQFVGAADP